MFIGFVRFAARYSKMLFIRLFDTAIAPAPMSNADPAIAPAPQSAGTHEGTETAISAPTPVAPTT